MKRLKLIAWVVCWGFSATLLFGQDTDPISLFDQFHEQPDSLPQFKLDTNWGGLFRTKMKEQYQEGQLSFLDAEGQWVELGIKLKARGNMRKQICSYPPVKVKIPKRELRRLGFNSMNEIKFVFPCGNSKKDIGYLYREALVYQLYEYIHPVCLRTKLAKIEAVRGERQRFASHCLLVEHVEQLEKRLECKVIERGIVASAILERDTYLKMVFFQYMILNTDWSVTNRHNLLLVHVPGFAEKIMPIPYDFDYSGFVNTHYAVPAEAFPIKSVREPYFMGRDVTEEEALETARFFLEKEEELLEHVRTVEFLDDRARKDVVGTLEDFFKILKNEKKVKKTFVTAKKK